MTAIKLTLGVVKQLFELACTPFSLREFRKKWTSFSWTCTPDSGDSYCFAVKIPGFQAPLWIDSIGCAIICAHFPFYYWEDYQPEHHTNPAEFERQHVAYEAAFQIAANLAAGILPAPAGHWVNHDADEHKAVFWAGRQDLLILQQAYFDPQFGVEVNFWLEKSQVKDFNDCAPNHPFSAGAVGQSIVAAQPTSARKQRHLPQGAWAGR